MSDREWREREKLHQAARDMVGSTPEGEHDAFVFVRGQKDDANPLVQCLICGATWTGQRGNWRRCPNKDQH